MNEIAAKLGEVGLPAPIKELAATHWDAVIVHQRSATVADALARGGRP